MKMEKIDALNQVAEFHQTFKHPIEPAPVIPAEDRCRLRVNLIAEELKEPNIFSTTRLAASASSPALCFVGFNNVSNKYGASTVPD